MTDPPVAPERPTGPGDPVAENRRRQRELYGEALGERVHRLLGALGVTQARLASALGLSPAMLSQLSGARRVKIGDPAVLGRLITLDRRVARGPVPPAEVEPLLEHVRVAGTPWGPAGGGCRCGAPDAPGPAGRGRRGAGPVVPRDRGGPAPGGGAPVTVPPPPGARPAAGE